jgi:tetratricopeptide (TPR) repeat protein
LKNLWRVPGVALAAAGLALIAGTPAALAAGNVHNPWALAGATAVAAAIAVCTGVARARHLPQQMRRPRQTLRVDDDWLAFPDGKLPMVRQIADPTRLGTHRAMPAGADSGAEAGSADAPAYIPRDLDDELRERLAAGGFVVLVGDSAAGKSRMAFEAVRATLPDHALIAPAGVDAIGAAIRRAADERRCVLWLDDLQRFFGPGGISAMHVGRLLSGADHHRVIVATIRASEQARLTAHPRDDDRTLHGLRDIGEVLDQAQEIRIARWFTTAELERARVRDWDPRIAEAIRHADGYGIAEYLATGPLLLRTFEDARSSAADPHARGAALVTAAIDIRRAGYLAPIPRDLLERVHRDYLDPVEHGRKRRESLAQAWEWATARQSAATGLLHPAGDNQVEVFDYLTDSVQRRVGPLDRVPEPVVRRALAAARATDADSLARTAYNQGRWQLAADAWRIACGLLARDPGVGGDHPDTLACRGNLALVLHDLGKLDEAAAEVRAVVTGRQRVLGPDHPDTLVSRGNLAIVLRDLGRLDEAEAEVRAVLAARRRMLGPDHPDSLVSRGNLALVLHDLGRLDEAEAEVRAVLQNRQRVLGPDHPATLTSRSNLGLVLRNLGRLGQAEAEHRAVLAARQRVLGPDHPGTLASRNNLAGVLRDLGRLDMAVAEVRGVLAARQLVLGPDHPDSLASRHSLARVLRDLGWLDEAEAEVRAVLAIRLRVLGPDHRSTLASRNNLAGVLHQRGRLDEAETEIRTVLATMLRVLGPDHPDTLACRGNLALVLREQGRPDEAEADIPAVLAARQQMPGPDRSSTPADGRLSAVVGADGEAADTPAGAGVA